MCDSHNRHTLDHRGLYAIVATWRTDGARYDIVLSEQVNFHGPTPLRSFFIANGSQCSYCQPQMCTLTQPSDVRRLFALEAWMATKPLVYSNDQLGQHKVSDPTTLHRIAVTFILHSITPASPWLAKSPRVGGSGSNHIIKTMVYEDTDD